MTTRRGRHRPVAVVVCLLVSCSAPGDGSGPSAPLVDAVSTSAPVAVPASSAPSSSVAVDPEVLACRGERSRVAVLGADLRVAPIGPLVEVFESSTGVAVLPVRAGLGPAAQRLLLRSAPSYPGDGVAPGTPSPDLAQVDVVAAEALAHDGLLATGALSDAVGDVPAGLVGPGASWVAPWLGVVAFVVVDGAAPDDAAAGVGPPTSFAALAADRRLTVALPGDPRDDAAAFAVVMAAAVASGGATDDILSGVDYVARLRRQRRLVADAPDVYVEVGAAAVARRESLSAMGVASSLVYPSDAVVAVPTVLAAIDGAPHAACAAQWAGFLLSDAAADIVAAAGLVPARWAVPGAARRHAADSRRNLPGPDLLASLHVVTATETALGMEVLRDAWLDRVGRLP